VLRSTVEQCSEVELGVLGHFRFVEFTVERAVATHPAHSEVICEAAGGGGVLERHRVNGRGSRAVVRVGRTIQRMSRLRAVSFEAVRMLKLFWNVFRSVEV
jgi:hypothetical protein